jgi:hypothetical protein
MCATKSSQQHQRRELQRLFDAGKSLACGKDAAQRPGVRQLVVITRGAAGAAIIHIETYLNGDWDNTLEEAEHAFPDLGSALAWLADNCAVAESELQVPAHPAK